MRMKSTIAQVAAYSGFSTATVSRAFTHPELLSPKTLDAIKKAATLLQYNSFDTNTRFTREYRVAVFVNLFQNFGEMEVLRGIVNSLRSWHFEVMLFESLDANKEIIEIRKLTAKGVVSAVIFVDAPKHEKSLDVLLHSDLSTVVIDHRASVLSRVFSPIESAVSILFNFALAHQINKLLFIGDLPSSTDSKEAIFLSRLREMNRSGNRKIEIIEHLLDPNRPPGPSELSGVISKEKPDAIFASSDFLSAQAHRDCLSLGLAVGKDIQILGYGDADIAGILNLTSIRVHFDALGRRAAEIVYSQIMQEGEVARDISEPIAPELVERGSTTPKM